MRVFISYAPTDRAWAEDLFRELTNEGLDVWLDAKELLPGDNWYLEAGQALRDSDAMVVLLSPSAVEAESVQRDVQYALGSERFQDRVIPVVLEPSEKLPWILNRMRSLHGSPAEVAELIADRLKQPPPSQRPRALASSR